MDFDLSVHIQRPPQQVFDFFADVQDHASYTGSPVASMEKTPLGPTRVGTRWHEKVWLGPLMKMTIWSTATAIEPGRRLEMDFRAPGMSGHIAYIFIPEGDGTLLRQVETLQVHGLLRPMGGLVGGMLGPRLKQRLVGIAAILERG